jgi:hypothetical protein
LPSREGVAHHQEPVAVEQPYRSLELVRFHDLQPDDAVVRREVLAQCEDLRIAT